MNLRAYVVGPANSDSQQEWMARSCFYANRLRYREIIEHFKQAGFTVQRIERRRWSALPLRRGALTPAFRQLHDDELRTKEFDVVLRPA
ncbi:MAG: hypothetical protein Q8R98_10730 [Rubrivivax sp.]|nr:hypothetical protein [Rubrivivax sp.]MDP3612317.1 hypothetical protein [Rubrivivax sp.]